MGKEIPVVSTTKSDEAGNEFVYCRVFCRREEPPPLRLLLDYLKSKNQVPLVPKMDPEALDDWAWVQVAMGYHRERKPIQLFCIRDRGTYKDVFDKEQGGFSGHLSANCMSRLGQRWSKRLEAKPTIFAVTSVPLNLRAICQDDFTGERG